jgi:hypothetical protein
MRTITSISLVAILFLTTSCREELTYNPFESSQYGFTRYLSEISETYYSNNVLSPSETTTIFRNPIYDSNGRVTSAYNNIVGYDANYTYGYSDDTIVTIAMCQSGKVIRREYVVRKGVIASCTESSSVNDAIKTYTYSYDSSNTLVNITVFDEEYDFYTNISLTWEYDNISSVEMETSSYTDIYEFVYNDKNERYNGKMPCFFSSCYVIGGVYGVDEILSIEGYFGTSISKDLPTTVYWNGIVSRVFEYSIDNNGYISTIKQVSPDSKKIYRIYSFKWN